MKASAIVAAVALLSPLVSLGEVDPFEPVPDPPRPERQIASLPKAISYSEDKEGHHVYVISGIYVSSPKHDVDDPGALLGMPLIPDCLECTFDFQKLTCTIKTSRKLTYSELAYAVDGIAELGGDMPYWAELEARDLPASTEYTKFHFDLAKVDDATPKGLAWFWLSSKEVFEMPFAFGDRFGSVMIVPTTGFCMCHSRYCIRLLDPDRKVVWSDTDTAFAGIALAVADEDEDLNQEILIRRDDHGQKSNFRIQRRSEQAAPSDGDKPPK
jgi:hypothetical protein